MLTSARGITLVLSMLALGVSPGDSISCTDTRVPDARGTTSPCELAPALSVDAPAGGEHWLAGTTHAIKWTASPQIDSVTIQLMRGRTLASTITTSPAGAGSIDWTIPTSTSPGTDYRIRLLYNRPGCQPAEYYSSANFEIRPTAPLILTSPNGGEAWTAGTTQLITWESTLVGELRIALLKAGVEQFEIGRAPISAGNFSWAICDFVGNGADYRVRIEVVGTSPVIADESDNNFAIVGSNPLPTLTLLTPNGGESLVADQNYTVTWSSTNPNGYVSVELYKGGVFQDYLGSAPMSAGFFDWHICRQIGNGDDYRIRIKWQSPCTTADVSDSSNADFSISGSFPRPGFTLTSPNGGETFVAGNTYPITWTSTNPIGSIGIELLKGDQYYASIATVPMADNSYNWTICQPIDNASDYRIRLSYQDCIALADQSDADFAITGSPPRPTLHLTSPNGGETWQAGQNKTITWQSTNPTGTVGLWLMRGGSFVTQIGSAPMSAGSIDWVVCPTVGDADNYRVYIAWYDCGPIVSDSSDADFSITGSRALPDIQVTSPNGGESWALGSTHAITWTSADPIGTVSIDLYQNGSYRNYLGSAPMAAGSFNWHICPSSGTGDGYIIRLTWTDCGATVIDSSNEEFSITGSALAITSPAGGESWATGTTHTISWTPNVLTGQATISLYKGGAFTQSIATTNGAAGSYDWAVCDSIPAGSDYKIDVSGSTSCGIASAQSPANFSITGAAPTFAVSSPNGGESWAAGSTHNITWTPNVLTGFATIALYKGQSAITQFQVPNGASGLYAWTLCESIQPGNDYRIAVGGSTGCSQVSDISDSNFTITSGSTSFALTSPNGGETWPIGSSQTITWTPLQPGSAVSLYLLRAGSFFLPIGSAPGDTGSFQWTVCPNIPAGTNYRVQIFVQSSGNCPATNDTSNADFSITGTSLNPTLTVTAPAAGAIWPAASQQTVTWTSTDPFGDVTVFLEKGGNSVATLGTAPMSAGSFTATVCPYVPAGSDYRIRLRGASQCLSSLTATSPGTFTINGTTTATIQLTSFNGGQSIAAGTTQNITWSISGASGGTVQIALLRSGAFAATIGFADPTAMSFAWNVCDELGDGNNYSILLYYIPNCGNTIAAFDQSDAPFSITGSQPPGPPSTLAFTRPVAGSIFQAGTTENITWVSQNPRGPVDLYLVTYRSGAFDAIAYLGSAPMADNGFAWSIPASLGDPTALYYLYGLFGCGQGSDQSDNFMITPSGRSASDTSPPRGMSVDDPQFRLPFASLQSALAADSSP